MDTRQRREAAQRRLIAAAVAEDRAEAAWDVVGSGWAERARYDAARRERRQAVAEWLAAA